MNASCLELKSASVALGNATIQKLKVTNPVCSKTDYRLMDYNNHILHIDRQILNVLILWIQHFCLAFNIQQMDLLAFKSTLINSQYFPGEGLHNELQLSLTIVRFQSTTKHVICIICILTSQDRILQIKTNNRIRAAVILCRTLNILTHFQKFLLMLRCTATQ